MMIAPPEPPALIPAKLLRNGVSENPHWRQCRCGQDVLIVPQDGGAWWVGVASRTDFNIGVVRFDPAPQFERANGVIHFRFSEPKGFAFTRFCEASDEP